jgi:serine/threonine protein kinase
MAEVYLCRLTGEEGFEKKVAVKVIHSRLSEDRYFKELFIREARIAASLVHPNLIQVFDFGKEGESHFLAMEFIDGWNLAQAISQARLRATRVPLPVWRYWMEGILAGIGHLHSRGILHRDISPSNILLSRAGAVKITDFGIARGALFKQGENAEWEGKFSYMSPEQARGEEASSSSDLFAAAVISAELFLLRRLLDEDSAEKTLHHLRQYDSDVLNLGTVPPAIADTVRKGLSTDREDRYANADEFSRAISAAVPSSPGRAALESFWDALFPEDSGEEDTVVTARLPGRRSEMILESREGYGKREARILKIGALTGMAAISVGGWIAWKRPASPVPLPSPAAVSQASHLHPAAVNRGGELFGALPPSEKPSSKTSRIGQRAHDGETLSKTVLIETDPGGVSVTLEDGTPLGRTPISLDISPWSGRKIVLQKEGYSGKSMPADVLSQFNVFRLEMERQLGTIEVIQAIPWAKVYDGDKYLGVTPIYNLKLSVGLHRLRFINEPLEVEKTQDVNVHPGVNSKLIVPIVEKKPSD